MSVSAPYCTTSDVQAKLLNTTLSSTTKPSLTQVTQFIAEVSDEMDERFKGAGIALPFDDGKTNFLKRVSCFGVLAEIYRSISTELDKSTNFQKLYDDRLSDFIKNPGILDNEEEADLSVESTVDYDDREIEFEMGERNW